MKNQYFGDVNDYLKYGLLRCFAETGWHVGICWMLTRDDARRDGRKLEYLSDTAGWRVHDPTLFDALRSAVAANERLVSRAEAGDIIAGAHFFSDVAPDASHLRNAWFDRAMSTLAEADLLFFDPDNGLEVKSTPRGTNGSSKYLYWDEVERAWQEEASLMIFQHFAREKRAAHTSRLVDQLGERAPGAMVIPIRTAHVLYLLALRPEHAAAADMALELIRARWARRAVV